MYDVVTFRRNKAKEGLVRPTLGQLFKPRTDFIDRVSRVQLTWPGSTHYEDEVIALGGTVFDTGSGTIGRFTANAVPTGWAQAANWQRYSVASWGGDSCGRWKSTASTSWANTAAVYRYKGGSQLSGRYLCSAYTSHWHTWGSDSVVQALCFVSSSTNPITNRVEIGAV